MKVTKSKFTLEEDIMLTKLVNKFGDSNWKLVASCMPARNSRQCRERWRNYLSPLIPKRDWTVEEDRIVLSFYHNIGPKWHVMKKFLPGRTSCHIRNHCLRLLRNGESVAKEASNESIETSEASDADESLLSKPFQILSFNPDEFDEIGRAHV